MKECNEGMYTGEESKQRLINSVSKLNNVIFLTDIAFIET